MVEQIQLKVSSPPIRLPGVDDAIAKLTVLDGLLDKLEGRKSINIAGFASVSQEVRHMSDNAKLALETFEKFGQKEVGARMRKGFSSLSEEATYLKKQINEIDAILSRAPTGAVRSANPAIANEVAKYQSMRAGAKLRLDEMAELPRSMNAEVIQEADNRAAAAATKLAGAEGKLASAAAESSGALKLQSDIVDTKAARMEHLEASARGVTAAERQSTQAMGENSLMSERWIQVKGEEAVLAEQKFRTGIGQTNRVLGAEGDMIVQSTNHLERYADQFRKIDAEFANKKSNFGLGTQEHIDLLREEAKANRAVIESMASAGHRDDPKAVSRDAKQAFLEARALQLEARKPVLGPSRKLFDDEEKAAARKPLLGPAKKEFEEYEQLQQRMRAAQDAQARYNQRRGAFAGGVEKTTKQSTPDGGRTETTTLRRDVGGLRETLQLTTRYDQHGRALTATLKEMNATLEATGRSATAAGRGFFNNLGTITAWAAGAATLYGTLSLIRHGLSSFTDIERQTAVLKTVFRGTDEEAIRLRDTVLSLAAANGRGAGEAIDAAVRFSRLGLSHKEVTEAVAVSLQAANVAEISTADAAEQLLAIFSAYRLQVTDLRVVLNELNTISNTYNVTNKDLLQGVARASSVAKQAGLGFSELIGIIGAGVGRTGRSGAEMGNAIKAMIVSMSNPAIQGKLSDIFKFDVKDSVGGMKDMSVILAELFVKFQELTKAEQQELVARVGGKQQASRITAILDGYITSQVLAIRAQQDLNSAERENENIRATLTSQLETLNTQFQRMSVNLANAGGMTSFNRTLTRMTIFLGNVLKLVANFPVAAMAMVALLGIMAIRLALTAARMQDGTVKGNFLTNTVNQLRGAYHSLTAAVDVANGSLARNVGLMSAAGRTGTAAAGGVTAQTLARGGAAATQSTALGFAGAGARAGGLLRGIPAIARLAIGSIFSKEAALAVGAMLLIQAAMAGVNKVFDYFSSNASKATDELKLYNEELEQTKAKASAAALSQRLTGTLAAALPRLAARNAKAARQAIEDYSSISPGTKDEKEQTRTQLLGLLEQGRFAEIKNRLEKDGARFAKEKADYAHSEVQQTAALIDLRQRAIGIVRKEADERRAAGKDTIEQEKKIVEIQKEIAGLSGEGAQRFVDAYDGEDDPDKSFGKRNEVIGEAIDSRESMIKKLEGLYSGGDSSEAVAAVRQQRQLDARRRDLDAYKADQNKPYEDKLAAERERMAALVQQKLERNEIEARDPSTRSDSDWIKGTRELNEEMQRVQDKIHAIQDAQAQNNILIDEETKKRRESLTEEQRKLDILKQYATLQDAINQGTRAGKIKTEQFKIGRNETEQLLNEARGIGYLGSDEPERRRVDAARRRFEAAQQQVAYDRSPLAADRQRGGGLTGYAAAFQNNQNNADALRHEREANAARQQLVREQANLSRTNSGQLLAGAGARFFEAKRTGDTLGQAKAQAEVLQYETRLEQVRLSLEERRYKIAADIANERRRENEEASKALQMAGREDQLRAALIAKFTKNRGGQRFSSDEFQFLEQNTKEAITRFNPQAAPDSLPTRSRELEQERALLEKNFSRISGAIEQTAKFIENTVGRNLITTPPPEGAPGTASAAGVAPIINLPAMQFSDQFGQMIASVQNIVTSRLDAQIAEMRDTMNAFVGGQRIAAAQGAGAAAI